MDELNNRILALWGQYHNRLNLNINNIDIPLLWPSCYFNPPEEVQILFIGLNPSDSFSGVANLIGNNPANLLFQNIIDLGFNTAISYNNQGYDWGSIAELEEIAFNNYNYFTRFRQLGNYILSGDENNIDNLNYYHLDLYQFRLQNSNQFLLIKNDNADFFNSQIEISTELIEQLKPKLIFVANKNASDLIIERFENYWNELKGCHVINKKNWKCDVFFSGMITQTRAIDNYSFQRLKWHMKSIFDGRLMQ